MAYRFVLPSVESDFKSDALGKHATVIVSRLESDFVYGDIFEYMLKQHVSLALKPLGYEIKELVRDKIGPKDPEFHIASYECFVKETAKRKKQKVIGG